MSLLNEVLKDLDARQAAGGASQALPSAVRPLPARRRAYWPWGGALLFAAVALALGAFMVLRASPPAVQPDVAGAVIESPAPPVGAPVAVPSVASDDIPPTEAKTPSGDLPGTDVAATLVAPPPVVVPPRVEDVQAPAPISVSKPLNPLNPLNPPLAAPARSLPQDGKSRLPQGTVGRLPASLEAAPQVARNADSAGQDDKPDKHAKAAIERSDAAVSPGERVDAEYRKAINALNQGRVAEAIDGLRGVLRSDPLQRAARQLLVKLLLEAKRTDEAIDVLRDGVQGQPAQIGWAMALARLQLDRGDLAAAWTTLEESLPAADHSADYQGFAGNVLQRLGRSREAVARFQAALRLAPGDGRWWLGLGLAHESEGNASEARDAFAHARQANNLSRELMALVEQKLR